MRLFVGNLPYSVTDSQLREIFSRVVGVAKAEVICENGKSRGFGYVELLSDGDAAVAIEELQGYEIGGRRIRVDVANPRPEPRHHSHRDRREHYPDARRR